MQWRKKCYKFSKSPLVLICHYSKGVIQRLNNFTDDDVIEFHPHVLKINFRYQKTQKKPFNYINSANSTLQQFHW